MWCISFLSSFLYLIESLGLFLSLLYAFSRRDLCLHPKNRHHRYSLQVPHPQVVFLSAPQCTNTNKINKPHSSHRHHLRHLRPVLVLILSRNSTPVSCAYVHCGLARLIFRRGTMHRFRKSSRIFLMDGFGCVSFV